MRSFKWINLLWVFLAVAISCPVPLAAAVRKKARQASRMANRMFIGGGSVAIIGGALMIWGMLAGDGESDAANDDAAGPTGLVPALMPDGAGLVLSGRF
jgi:hypothetical protein